MCIVPIAQNTPEWLDWRKGKLGASDAPIIMGVSKWCTPWQLYMRKLRLIPDQDDNQAMARGRANESEALAAFNSQYGFNCIPVVMQHEEYPWMIASLDGWDAEKQIAVEIKCPGKEDHEICDTTIPAHYFPQVQHQLQVCNTDKMFYWSWYKNEGKCVGIDKWMEFTKDMIEKELDFMRRLKEFDPPDLCDRDYIENLSREWKFASAVYAACKREKDRAVKDYEESREDLIRLSGEHNCKGSGIRLTKSIRKGNIDFNRIPELENVDLETYRKEPITTWRISEE